MYPNHLLDEVVGLQSDLLSITMIIPSMFVSVDNLKRPPC